MKGINGIDCLGNPRYKKEVMADISFCYDLEQYLGGDACCYDYSCAYASCCKILRDSVERRG